MTYTETLDFLFTRLPYFTRDGKAALKPDLTNTILLCEAIGNPHLKFKCIHIAGTNGKGSTSNMLSAILQLQGYKTGLYTSPHLKDFRERIRIDGEMITESFVIDFTEKIIPYLDTIQPSFFEITVAMCFDYFAQQEIDYAVIETGLGGRLDSTNIIHPILSIITNIGYDHMDLLGDTLSKIAYEKAGIIKPEIPVVIGESHTETDAVFIEKAKVENAPIYFADQNPNYYNTEIETDLRGIYQNKNAITVMQSVEVLQKLGVKIDTFTAARALRQVQKLTGFRGRWEIIQENPKIIADTGHNEHGLRLVFEQLKQETFEHLHIVFGMVADKDRSKILKLLPINATYYFCKPDLPRGLDPSVLKDECNAIGLLGKTYDSVQAAYIAANENAKEKDLIFVGGSTFVVAEIL
ncbi:MAG: bifunctional folylpolyglutamate synthase/dihydrofolate synthase [bacterium]|nr:bifunctional folylpolyglutamate synthase/dihydrofolate synthase [bacterium]